MSTTTEILQRVEALNASSQALTAEPVRPRIKALIDAGLLKSTRMLSGPLGLPTGEVWLRITDDGRKLLAN
jgi:DNA-binding Lrp family transcriptional regulator